MAFHAGLRVLDADIEPVKIQGLILNEAFFGGVERTESEVRLANDPIVSPALTDLLWELALPEGADRDHEYCNPLGGGSTYNEKIGRLPKCLVRGYGGDALVDRQKMFAEMAKARGVQVVENFQDGGHHGVEIFDAAQAEALYNDIRNFIYNTPPTSTL